MDISSFNYIDYAVMTILITSGILAILRGFARELLGILGWVLAVIFGRLLQDSVTNQVEIYINDPDIAEFLGWLIPFIFAALAWFIFANMIASSLKKQAIGALDRPLGFVFGLARGMVIVAVIYMSALFIAEEETELPNGVVEASMIKPIRIVAMALTGFAPEGIKTDLRYAIPDQDIGDITKGITQTTDDAVDTAGDLLPDEISIPGSEN